MKPRLFLIAVACISWMAAQGFSQEYPDSVDYVKVQTDAMEQAMDYLEIKPYELGFDKLWVTDDTSRLRRVEEMMTNPLAIPEYVTDWGDILDFVGHDFATGVFEISKDLDAPIGAEEVANLGSPVKAKLATSAAFNSAAIQEILRGIDSANPWMDKALNSISKPDREAVLMVAPAFWEDEDDSTDNGLKGALHRSYGIAVDTSREVNADTIRHISAKFNRHDLLLAGIAVLRGIQTAIPLMDQLKAAPAKVQVPGVSGACIGSMDLPWGKAVIGGPGDNTYNSEFALIIDVGGNDTYNSRSAGAVGDIGNRYSVVVDLAGNDNYRSDSTFVSLGAGVLGIGVLIDLEGHDVYRSYHISQGAGFFGIGILADYSGWDDYRAGYFAQGSGQVGVGWLFDGGGNDIYTLDTWGQGFGSMFGFGISDDMGGSDTYRAGGRYFHHPLRPEDSRSFAQGFGMGFRPRGSGGIGFLYDKAGNDFYNAEVYAQGTSYWYSLGMLLDRAGQDFYNAAQYSQGAGIHLSVGALIDQAGEDHYYSKFGPAQGEGHDLAVGVLIDNKGNDTYMTTGGQGIGLTNSVGIFIDGEGNDTYTTIEPEFGQGSVRAARGFSGAGIFLDLEGFDHYPRDYASGDRIDWIQQDWGVGIDLPRDVITPEEAEPEVVIQPADTLRPVKDIFHDASLWEVTENRLKVRTARKALILKGMDAIEYVFAEKMGTDDGLEQRAIEDLFRAYPDSAAIRLNARITNPDKYIRGNTIYFIGLLKRKEAVPQLLELLQNNEYEKNWTGVIWALGEIGDPSNVVIITPHLTSPKERRRIYTAVALGKMKSFLAIDPLIRALDDSVFTVRSAASYSMASFGIDAISPLIDDMEDGHSSALKIATLGKTFDKAEQDSAKAARKHVKAVRTTISKYLDSADPRVRLETAIALNRLHDKASQELIRKCCTIEDHPLVKPALARMVKEFDDD